MNIWILMLLENYKHRRKTDLSSAWLNNRNLNLRFAFSYKKLNEAYLDLSAKDMTFAKETIAWIKMLIVKDEIKLDALREGLQYLKTHGQRIYTWKAHLILVGAFLGIIGTQIKPNSIGAGAATAVVILGVLLAAERIEMNSHSSATVELIAFLEFINEELTGRRKKKIPAE